MIAIFIFYSIANGVQSSLAFSKEFKHCNVITFDGRDWIMFDFDREGFKTRKIYCTDARRLIRAIKIVKGVSAILSVEISQRKKIRWKPYLVRSCNEVCRYATGIDIGFTFNPIHLYFKLLKYREMRNYEVLGAWRRAHGIPRRRQ